MPKAKTCSATITMHSVTGEKDVLECHGESAFLAALRISRSHTVVCAELFCQFSRSVTFHQFYANGNEISNADAATLIGPVADMAAAERAH